MSMKDLFPEWYELDEAAIGSMVRTGIIAFDTNVLFDLYRHGTQRRTEICDAIESIIDRVFIPYQVCLEFQRRRLSVIHATQSSYRAPAQKFDIPIAELNKIRDSEVKSQIRSLFEDARSIIDRGTEEICFRQSFSLSNSLREDPVRDFLDGLPVRVGASLGARPSDSDHQRRMKEFEDRARKLIPPGYPDEKLKDKVSAAGDYLIWCELIEFAKSSCRPLIFVTNDDSKGDWYRTKIGGQTLGPLPDLIDEFRKDAKQPYYQVRLPSFLRLRTSI